LKGEIEKKKINKIKKIRTRLVKIICHKFRLNDRIKKIQKGKEKKEEIKTIRIKL
jgi:hypothetical protein